MKRERESIDVRAHKMMRGRVEPFIVSTMVGTIPTVVHVTG
jgi:hypothetical protein